MEKVCEICGRTENCGFRLVRDHDHKTGFVRGILCDPCNARVGHYETGMVLSRFKATYVAWLEKYRATLLAYLSKPSTQDIYYKKKRDEVTGFTIGQLKQQARSSRSKYGEAARKRLKVLQVKY